MERWREPAELAIVSKSTCHRARDIRAVSRPYLASEQSDRIGNRRVKARNATADALHTGLTHATYAFLAVPSPLAGSRDVV